MTVVAPALGVLAGVVAIADAIPYVRDIRRGTTRPHRGTWLIWAALTIVACLSQRADGASWSLVMAGTQAVFTTLIFMLAIRRGVGGITVPDLVMVGIAAGGIVGWLLADEPIVATACVVAADLVAVALMVPKTWVDPRSETLSTYALAGASGALAAGSVAALEPSLLLYPVYYCVANGALALLIARRRAAVGGVARRPVLAVPHP